MKALQERVALALDPQDSAPVGYDPYSEADLSNAPREKRRRTLDDMRKLSEEIKRSRE